MLFLMNNTIEFLFYFSEESGSLLFVDLFLDAVFHKLPELLVLRGN